VAKTCPWRSAIILETKPDNAAYLGEYGAWRYWVRGRDILALFMGD
jgi:hypothetical protein